MKARALTLIIFLAVVIPAIGQDELQPIEALRANLPVPIIVGPSGGVAGDLIILDASDSSATHFAWLCVPELPDGRVTVFPIEDGRKCVVSSVPGTRTIILAVSTADGVAIKKHVITISGDAPNPKPDDPKPTPPKPDNPPDGQYQLASYAMTWAADIQDVSKAKALSGSFEAIASQAAAGAISSVTDLQRETQASNRDALDDSIDIWRPWFEKLQGKLKELNNSGELQTLDDHVTAWNEIADGLRRVK